MEERIITKIKEVLDTSQILRENIELLRKKLFDKEDKITFFKQKPIKVENTEDVYFNGLQDIENTIIDFIEAIEVLNETKEEYDINKKHLVDIEDDVYTKEEKRKEK